MSDYTTQDLEDNLNYLAETKRQIKEILIDKGQEVSDDDTFRSYVDKIDSIGNDATATANEVAQGYTIYKDGKLIEGNIEIINSIYQTASQIKDYTDITGHVYFSTYLNLPPQGKLLRDSSWTVHIQLGTSPSTLASSIGLTASKIVKGYKILNVEGAVEIPDYNIRLTDSISTNTGASSSPSENRVLSFIEKVDLTDVPITTNSLKAFFWDAKNLKEVTGMSDTSSVINTQSMFQNCNKLESIPLFNTSNVTNMQQMFDSCVNLTTIPLLNTGKVITMQNMFEYCYKLESIPLLDTSNVTNMQGMFRNCRILITIPLLNTNKVTDMANIFSGCTNLESIPQIDTGSVTSTQSMFSGCNSLTTIPLLNTSNVTSMNSMFTNCTNLESIPQIDTSKVTNMSYMFYKCNSLTTIPLLNTSSVTNMTNMFQNCTNLESIPQIDTSKVTNMSNMFNGCTKLETLPVFNLSSIAGSGLSSTFTGCASLSDESLNNIMASCITATNTSPKTLGYTGLNSTQRTKCQSLSNYQDFINAGWSA